MILWLRALAMVVLLAAILFGSAGRWDLPFFWAYVGLYAITMVVFLVAADPGLREERLRFEDTRKGLTLRVVLLPFLLAELVIAGLDAGRFHWSDTVPFGLQVAGLAGCVLAMGLVLAAVLHNRFF